MKKHVVTDHIRLLTDLCIACEKCIQDCPKNVLGTVGFLNHKHAHVNQAEACVGCLKCVKACQQQAIIVLRVPNPGKMNDRLSSFLPEKERIRGFKHYGIESRRKF